jgi:hypothetical protein
MSVLLTARYPALFAQGNQPVFCPRASSPSRGGSETLQSGLIEQWREQLQAENEILRDMLHLPARHRVDPGRGPQQLTSGDLAVNDHDPG